MEGLSHRSGRDYGGEKEPRYYQRIAINRTVEAIGKGQQRILGHWLGASDGCRDTHWGVKFTGTFESGGPRKDAQNWALKSH